MRASIYRCPCPLGDDECQSILTLTVYPGRRGTYQDPAEGPEVSATGCKHVDDASGWEWRRPGGIEETLWALVEDRTAESRETAIEAAIERRREDASCPR